MTSARGVTSDVLSVTSMKSCLVCYCKIGMYFYSQKDIDNDCQKCDGKLEMGAGENTMQ
jgi:hypothetical protein